MLNLEATSKHQVERIQAYDDVRNIFFLHGRSMEIILEMFFAWCCDVFLFDSLCNHHDHHHHCHCYHIHTYFSLVQAHQHVSCVPTYLYDIQIYVAKV